MEWLARPGADLIYASGRDITTRLAQEKALRESENRLHDLMLTAGDWIWEADAEYRYTQCSDGVRAVLGYEPAEVIGKTPVGLHDARRGGGDAPLRAREGRREGRLHRGGQPQPAPRRARGHPAHLLRPHPRRLRRACSAFAASTRTSPSPRRPRSRCAGASWS